MNQIDLAGKTAVVTGGTRGIGLAIAQRMATYADPNSPGTHCIRRLRPA